MKLITIHELALVFLIGPSGYGKSTFARKHFMTTEILSSDFCRELISNDDYDQSATKDAFVVLHFIAAKRLARGKLTVIDATNVRPEARRPLLALAQDYRCPRSRSSSTCPNGSAASAITHASVGPSVPT